MMINLRLVSQEHSQLPTESFRLSPGLRASAALFLPWMSETFYETLFFYTLSLNLTSSLSFSHGFSMDCENRNQIRF
ncbi:hypothetical protein MKW98_013938 [Papaver atlanticum]|uniref:Uncharacterized protein n=1 Tax=Papaver atlanticum TaxID=357466 RepID=A0AAD4XGP5_9MAGN|nr:hypothetical protein MKW98_013938 [Papaver atlanticum]